MVFQRSNPFPKSVFENVAYGLRIGGERDKQTMAPKVERALRQAALWDEVKDRLDESGSRLSGGQQQRLCIARALAVEPEVLLMDEPASALDPIATAKIEDLISELREIVTIVIVTHNMQQAARVSQRTAFFYMGRLVEIDDTHDDLHAAHATRDRGLHHGEIRMNRRIFIAALALRSRAHATTTGQHDDHRSGGQDELHRQGLRHDGHPRPALGRDVHEGARRA